MKFKNTRAKTVSRVKLGKIIQMYFSKITIDHEPRVILKKRLLDFLRNKNFIYSKALKRKIFLTKLPDAILERKDSQKRRLQCFRVAIDILRRSKHFSQNPKNRNEFEIKGFSAENYTVFVHLREEISQKNRQLFFVSCYFKKTPTS